MKKIVGMWNPSVILTYLGMIFAVTGMFLAFGGERINGSYICLIAAGICDLFDGAAARRVKRTKEEKEFGIQLDSLVDVLSFSALPLSIFLAMGFRRIPHLFLFSFYALAGIARLGYFNVMTADTEGPVPYYQGLPVTYTALVFPLAYLLRTVMTEEMFSIFFAAVILAVTILEFLKVKIKKPRGMAYLFFALLAVVLTVYYWVTI